MFGGLIVYRSDCFDMPDLENTRCEHPAVIKHFGAVHLIGNMAPIVRPVQSLLVRHFSKAACEGNGIDTGLEHA